MQTQSTLYNLCKLPLWLITSPEYHMKRILSIDIGPIYQICHAFRNEEIGSYHNPEFTILEWYQPFYNMFDMIDIIESFLKFVFNIKFCEKISYQDIFMKYVFFDPFSMNIKQLNNVLIDLGHKHLINSKNNVTDLLNLIFLIYIEPKIGSTCPIFVYYYPAEQALLAKINNKNKLFSERFEFFFKGMELGNGFCELIDSEEQKKRFEADNVYRKRNRLPIRTIDFRLLQSLSSKYMPNCSGVAIGIDRIIMIMLNALNINQVLSFSFLDS